MFPLSIFKGLATNWKAIVILVLVVALGLYIFALRTELALAKAKEQSSSIRVDQYAVANAQLENQNKALQTHITQTDSALTKISSMATDTQRKLDVLNGTIIQQNAALEQQLATVMAQPVPQTCPDTITYLIDAVKDYPK